MTVLALATVPENKQKSEQSFRLTLLRPDRWRGASDGKSEWRNAGDVELDLRVRARRELVAAERVFGAAVRLQGFRGVRVLRQIRFTPDERPLLLLLP